MGSNTMAERRSQTGTETRVAPLTTRALRHDEFGQMRPAKSTDQRMRLDPGEVVNSLVGRSDVLTCRDVSFASDEAEEAQV